MIQIETKHRIMSRIEHKRRCIFGLELNPFIVASEVHCQFGVLENKVFVQFVHIEQLKCQL